MVPSHCTSSLSSTARSLASSSGHSSTATALEAAPCLRDSAQCSHGYHNLGVVKWELPSQHSAAADIRSCRWFHTQRSITLLSFKVCLMCSLHIRHLIMFGQLLPLHVGLGVCDLETNNTSNEPGSYHLSWPLDRVNKPSTTITPKQYTLVRYRRDRNLSCSCPSNKATQREAGSMVGRTCLLVETYWTRLGGKQRSVPEIKQHESSRMAGLQSTSSIVGQLSNGQPPSDSRR